MGGDAAGAAVDKQSVGVDGAEIAAGDDVSFLEVDAVYAHCFEGAASDDEVKRIVAEEG